MYVICVCMSCMYVNVCMYVCIVCMNELDGHRLAKPAPPAREMRPVTMRADDYAVDAAQCAHACCVMTGARYLVTGDWC